MKAPKKFAIWSFSSSKSSSSISDSSRTKKKKKKVHKIHGRKRSRGRKLTKNADFLPFLALFQGKELCFVLCGKKFLKRPLPFGLNSCMTQQNKGISKTFYYIRKKQSSLPWNKVKAPKNFAIWSFSSSKNSSSISGSSRTKKRRKRYTKYTEEKEAEDENWQKNADFLPFLALFQGKELCFVLCGKFFDTTPSFRS